MKEKTYENIIIGGGSGLKLANLIAEHDQKVLLIERGPLGGTCLNRGCIPSKMLIHTAELAQEFQRASLFDLDLKRIKINFDALVQRVTHIISSDSESIRRGVMKNPNIDLISKPAKFLDSHTLQIGTKKFSGKRIFIATGAIANIPENLNLQKTPYLTYKESLRLQKRPEHIIILGGGYIAAELGFFYAALGAQVSILVRSCLLRKEDPDIRKEFRLLFGKKVDLYENAHIKSVDFKNNTYSIDFKQNRKTFRLQSDQLLIALGMRGSTQELGLENTRIKVDSHGFIQVNRSLKTAEKHIWAFGDVIGQPLYKHKANFEADYLFKAHFLSKKIPPIHYPPIPKAIFSYPQIASVGKTEEELKSCKIDFIVGKHSYKDSGRGMATLPEGGFVKILIEKDSQRLLGAHIIGDEASTMSHIFSAFLQKNARLKDLLDMIYIHPSLPEIIRKAAQNAKEQIQN